MSARSRLSSASSACSIVGVRTTDSALPAPALPRIGRKPERRYGAVRRLCTASRLSTCFASSPMAMAKIHLPSLGGALLLHAFDDALQAGRGFRARYPIGCEGSRFGSFGVFWLDDLDPDLLQLLSPVAVDRRGGQNDARRARPRGLLVQTTLALQTRLDGRPDAGGDLDKDMLVIMDQDIELLAGDGRRKRLSLRIPQRDPSRSMAR